MIVVGTADGVVELALDGSVIGRALPGREVTAVSGEWAVADGLPATWRDDRTVALPPGVGARVVLALGGGRALVGTSRARLLQVGGPRGVLADGGFDTIPGRSKWSTPWGGAPDVRSIAPGPAGPIVGVLGGGVWRPEGDRWLEAVAPESEVHQVVSSGKVVAVASGVGVGQSDDGGKTWDWRDHGLHAAYCRAAALADGWLLVGASTGAASTRGALYRRPLDDVGEPFAPCGTAGGGGLPAAFGHNIDTNELAAAGNLVAVGTPDGDLYLSEDSGETWHGLGGHLPGVRCVAFAP